MDCRSNSAGSQLFPFNMVFRPCKRRPRSLLRFASIEGLERVKDPASLAPKRRFIAAEPIKGEVGKIGDTQKATGELDSAGVGFDPRVGQGFYVNGTERSCIAASGFGPTEHCGNYLTGMRKQLAVLPIVMQLLNLNLEQSGLHSRGTPQPPQNARQSQHELALDS